MDENVKKEQNNTQLENGEVDVIVDWQNNPLRGFGQLLHSMEDLAWCLRIEVAYLTGSQMINDQVIESSKYQNRKARSYLAMPLIVTGAIAALFLSAQVTGVISSVVTFLSFTVLSTSLLHYILFTKQDDVLMARKCRNRYNNDSNDNDFNGTGGGKDADLCTKGNANEGSLTCDGASVSTKCETFIALVKREACDLGNEIVNKANNTIDRIANAMFGGMCGKEPAFAFGGMCGKEISL